MAILCLHIKQWTSYGLLKLITQLWNKNARITRKLRHALMRCDTRWDYKREEIDPEGWAGIPEGSDI